MSETTLNDVEALAFEAQALIVRPHFDIEIPDAGRLLVAELKGLLSQAETFLSQDIGVASIQVTDAAAYEQIGLERDVRKKLTSDLNAKRLEVTRPFDAAKGTIKDFVDASIVKLESAVKTRDTARATFKREEEAKRLAEENRRRALLAEEERKLKEAAAKIEAEAKAKAERLRLDAEEAERAGNVGKAAKLQERAEAAIGKAEIQVGDLERKAAHLPPATVASSVPDGGYRKSYKPKLIEKTNRYLSEDGPALTGFELFILSIADGIRSGSGFPPSAYLLPNMPAINKYCDSTAKGGSFRLPGFELVEDDIPVSQRSKR